MGTINLLRKYKDAAKHYFRNFLAKSDALKKEKESDRWRYEGLERSVLRKNRSKNIPNRFKKRKK